MTSYESMTQKLAPLGLYRLTPGTMTDLELRVYADALDGLFAQLDEMTREYFVVTALDWGLTERERFFGKEKTDLSAETRRSMLLAAESETGADATPAGLERFIRSCGAQDFTVTEHPSVYKITVVVRGISDIGIKKLIRNRLEAYIPAHCKLAISFENTE